MMSILSILVVMLVHGHMVRGGEIFPVSMFTADSGDHQPIDPPKKNELELLQGSNVAERAVSLPTEQHISAQIIWMKTNIVDKYGFVEHSQYPRWTSQPSFAGEINSDDFKTSARTAETFFRRFAGVPNPWETLQEKVSTPQHILYVTAARYLLVTDILRRVSSRVDSFGACEEERDKLSDIPLHWTIPAGGVCFPKPYGSATYKSDYDVGLIGEKSGKIVVKFNEYFETNFGKPSELVFDTNVYAHTLEFAMPSLFPDLPKGFLDGLTKLEEESKYKMQELASALMKVYKYNDVSFRNLKITLYKTLEEEDKVDLEHWINEFENMNMRKKSNEKASGAFRRGTRKLVDFRRDHNENYQYYVKWIRYSSAKTVQLAKALLYAAEAYHTRGAMRHVVQGIQMHAIIQCPYYMPLSTFDLWVSMIENWGDASKERQHCGPRMTVTSCLLKMSKYLSRMFDAMRVIRRARLPKTDREKLLDFVSISDPELVINILLRYKKCNQPISQEVKVLAAHFWTEFDCDLSPDSLMKKFPMRCFSNIHLAVNDYNFALAKNVRKVTGLKIPNKLPKNPCPENVDE